MKIEIDFIGAQWGVGFFVGPLPVLRVMFFCVLISVWFGNSQEQ